MRRLATTLRTTRSFASAPTTPRIAICGAGVSGLTLAGILSNGMNTRKMVEARGRGPMDWEDFREFNPLPSWVPFPVAKFAVKRFAALTKAWYAWERARGGGGTCEGNAPLYASVERLLAEQKN